MLTDRVKEHIESLDDRQLAEYVATGELMYEPEAIDFARQEFSLRELDEGVVLRLEAEVQRQVEARAIIEQAIADEPLAGAGKVLAFIGGLLGLEVAPKAFFIWLKMDSRGEYRKARDVKRWFLLGLAINIVAIVIFIYSHTR